MNPDDAQPQADAFGYWTPPLHSAGFYPQVPSRVYRWRHGRITSAEGYQWYGGNGWGPANVQLESYRTSTMFYCNHLHFLTANGDASTPEVTADPMHRWNALAFRHNGAVSQIFDGGELEGLAGNESPWVRALGLEAYADHGSGYTSEGLTGNLAHILALVAMSCRREDLGHGLRAWHDYQWTGHGRPHGS